MSAKKQATEVAVVAPAPVAAKIRGGRKGKTLGLNVRETWAHILRENAVAKKTDAQLADFMFAEFCGDGRPRPADYTEAGLPKVRSWYNSGQGTGVKPAEPSYQYDENGLLIGGPKGTKTKLREAAKAEAQAAKVA